MRGENSEERNVLFWSSLGSLLLLLSTCICIAKVSLLTTVFPFTGFVSMVLCMIWKRSAIIPSLCIFALTGSASIYFFNLDNKFWHLGMILSFALATIITGLSIEEVFSQIRVMRQESTHRLREVMRLNKKLESQSSAFGKERIALQSRIEELEAQLCKVEKNQQQCV